MSKVFLLSRVVLSRWAHKSLVEQYRVPLQMPPLPDHFVERPEPQSAVKEQLLCENDKGGTLVVSAIYGLGGIGKSVLASKLTHDGEVQDFFADGILWVTLGQNPDILPLLSGWIQALGDYDYKPTAVESASNHLQTLLYDKCILLVVDDVWNPAHLEPFRVGGDKSRVMVTTREARIPGAALHSLDVMDDEQALALMTQKIREPLSTRTRQQALDFAGRVGYLPLALELAASQIEDGVTWTELLEDFADELTRLESLDMYERSEMPDDEKRRKYSLLACFNLSLKQLSAEQLRQFAWLGVVPEDVSLTREMAETLWQVTGRQAGFILRTFRAKSLVLQGAKQVSTKQQGADEEERPSYRMHDLMHDLARQLLQQSVEPEGEDALPGLGLTVAAAHGEFLDRYRAKVEVGEDGQVLWHTLKDDGYIFAHLTWHIEQAEQPEEIHRMLRVSNRDGRNGWYEACDALGNPAGFVSDLGRAWGLAVESYEEAPGEVVALLYRYALIRGSLNSLASSVPAEMVGGLVKEGFWQAAQGLAYAQQAQNPWHRAACISAIAPYMPEALLPEVLKTVGQIRDAAYRSYVLSKLAERFPEVWADVLNAIERIQDRYGQHRQQNEGFSHRAFALTEVIEKLPAQYLERAIKIANQIQNATDKATSLIGLATQKAEVWPNALSIAQEIEDESSQSVALSEIAQHLPEVWPEALAVAQEIEDESSRSVALSEIAQHLPEVWPEALAVAQKIKNESSRSHALSEIAQHLPVELLPEVIAAAREMTEYEFFQSTVLNVIAQHLPEVWPEALAVARKIEGESSRSVALSEIAQHLPEVWPEALVVAQKIKNESSRSRALSEIVQYLPVELLPEALAVARKIEDESSRSGALSAIAQYLPEVWPEALAATRKIEDESSRSGALSAIAQYLPELWSEALAVARKIKNESSRSGVLSEIAQHLPEVWPEALAVAQEIEDESPRSRTLSAIAQRLPVDLLPEALSAAREIEDEFPRSRTLSAIAQRLPVDLLPEALSAAREIENKSSRSRILNTIAHHLSEVWPEALAVAREIEDESSRSVALSTIAHHLSEVWPEALAVARGIKNEFSRALTLSTIVQHLPEVCPEALAATQEIKDEFARSHALNVIAERLPAELLPEALAIAREIKDEFSRSLVLSTIAEHLPAELLPEALAIAREIKDESSRSRALSAIAHHLPAELLYQALKMIWVIQDKYFRAQALQGSLFNLEKLSISFPDWAKTLDILAYQDRDKVIEALSKCRSIVTRLGNRDTLPAILQSLREICQQWP